MISDNYMTKENQINYIAPSMEVVRIEVEQCILSGSIENVGDRNPELDW